MLLTSFVFPHAINDQKTHPIFRWGQACERLVSKPPQQDPSIPIGRGQQPTQMPLDNLTRGQPRQPFEGGFVLINRLTDHQPAEDQVVAMTKHRPLHLQPVGHVLGQIREL
jgi:hypothetical protein